jgi:peptidoglycan hydrolase-like protein with peptidoglycan-binding domain
MTNPGQTTITARKASGIPPQRAIDGVFGPHTRAAVETFKTWGGVSADGIVGDQTWSVSLRAASATLETQVGIEYVIG